MSDPTARHLGCIETVCAALDSLQEYGIAPGSVPGLFVLHGLAMYARDTARVAVGLIDDGQILAAGALTRVVIEHAVLAQWVKEDPEVRGALFFQQSVVERQRWFEVVLNANFDMQDPLHVGLTEIEKEAQGPKLKNVADEFDTVKNLFGTSKTGRMMYLTYRNLSQFIHPSALTFARYSEDLPLGGKQMRTTLQANHSEESLSFHLAVATVLATLPYLDVIGEPVSAAVIVTAQSVDVPTTMAD